ncbi:MAG: hypothetical protein UY58_C0011G0001, partial [Candidatus Magasanikbacteria bacterium GW2011_GWA2_50_22]
NPENAHTIKISADALKAHLGHGDTVGACVEENPEKNKAEDNYIKAKDNYEKAKVEHSNALQNQKQEGFGKIMNAYQAKLLKEEYSYREIRDRLANALRGQGQSKVNYSKTMNEYKARLAKENQNYHQRREQLSRAMQVQKSECSKKAMNEYRVKMVKEEEIYRKARNEYYKVTQTKKK